MQKLIYLAEPSINIYLNLKKNPFQKFFYTISSNPFFEYFMSFILLTDLISACTLYDEAPIIHYEIIKNIGFVCKFLFTFEFLTKLFSVGLKHYFSSKWNSYDFIILFSQILGEIFFASIKVIYIIYFLAFNNSIFYL